MTHKSRTIINLFMIFMISILPVMNCHASVVTQSFKSPVDAVNVFQGHHKSHDMHSGHVEHDSHVFGFQDNHHTGKCSACGHCYMMCSIFYDQSANFVHGPLLSMVSMYNSNHIPVDIRPPI